MKDHLLIALKRGYSPPPRKSREQVLREALQSVRQRLIATYANANELTVMQEIDDALNYLP